MGSIFHARMAPYFLRKLNLPALTQLFSLTVFEIKTAACKKIDHTPENKNLAEGFSCFSITPVDKSTHCSPHIPANAYSTATFFTLTDSLPLSCIPFARRDSVFDLLSISSMIPWIWSPEIPWKSMAPGPGRNVQLSASALQPTTSIYCSLVPRCAPVSQRIRVGSEALGDAHNTSTAPEMEISSSPGWKATGRKEKPKKLQHGWDSQGGGAPVFPLSFRLSSRKKKPKSIVQMMRQTGVEGREEGRGDWTVDTGGKNNDSKFLCSLFLVISRPLISLSVVPCCLEVRLGLPGV